MRITQDCRCVLVRHFLHLEEFKEVFYERLVFWEI